MLLRVAGGYVSGVEARKSSGAGAEADQVQELVAGQKCGIWGSGLEDWIVKSISRHMTEDIDTEALMDPVVLPDMGIWHPHRA